MLTALWNPRVQTRGPSFGVGTNGFGFTITGSSNLVIVVEACTNLVNSTWLPVGTNTLIGGASYFSDPRNFFSRFSPPPSPCPAGLSFSWGCGVFFCFLFSFLFLFLPPSGGGGGASFFPLILFWPKTPKTLGGGGGLATLFPLLMAPSPLFGFNF